MLLPVTSIAGKSISTPSLETITIEPVYDIWINEANPSANYSDDGNLYIGTDEFEFEKRSLLLFNLSAIPAEAEIQTASLELFFTGDSVNNPSVEICAHRITEVWGTVVTWNTKPGIDDTCSSSAVVTSATNTYYRWDNLGSLVNAWHQGTQPNFGLIMKQYIVSGVPFQIKQFTSVRQVANHPRLIVEYSLPGAPTPTPSSTGNIQGVVWVDDNQDGIHNPGEGVLAGTQIELIRDGVVLASRTVDPFGLYSFNNLPVGNYMVDVVSLPVSGYSLVSGIDPWEVTVATGDTAQINFGYHPFNVQIQAVEVTQGVRTEIPTRTAPSGSLTFSPDSSLWTHVAGRRTIVRVYPWLSISSATALIPPLSARLSGFDAATGVLLPGSPLHPVHPTLVMDPSDDMDALRAEAGKTWLFILPEAWLHNQIRLGIEANPPGSEQVIECSGCSSDNQVVLPRVYFEDVGEVEYRVYRTLWPNVNPDGTVQWTFPTDEDVNETFTGLFKVWPVNDFSILQRTAIGCLPNDTWCRDPLVDGPISPQSRARNERDFLGIGPGEPTFFPELLSPVGRNDSIFGGQAGIGSTDFWSRAYWSTMAQESGHAGPGLGHAGAIGHPTSGWNDVSYPDPHGGIEENAFGFDIFSLQVQPPSGDTWDHTHDFMSYGGGQEWISRYTWFNIFNWLRGFATSQALAQMPDVSQTTQAYLRLEGSIDHQGDVSLKPAFYVELSSDNNQPGQGDYSLKLMAADDQLLFERRFELSELTHHDEGIEAYFVEDMPIFAELDHIVLSDDNGELATFTVSANAPQVELLSPNPGDSWEAVGNQIVFWNATDSDGDLLQFRVEASQDQGQTWWLIGGSTESNQAEIDLATFPGAGSGWLIRVQASDGLKIGTSEVGPITVASKSPKVFLFQPDEGISFAPGEEIMLAGQAEDWEDGPLMGNQLEWLVDGQSVGYGKNNIISDLSEGIHTIRLRAINSHNIIAEQEVSIEVAPDDDYDGLPNDWENQYGLNPNQPDAGQDVDQDQLLNWQELVYQTNPLLDDSDGDGFDDLNEIFHGTDPNDPTSHPPFNMIYLPLIHR